MATSLPRLPPWADQIKRDVLLGYTGTSKRRKQTGGCACGQVRYHYDAEPFIVHACHCTDCQRLTGSAFVINIFVPEDAFYITGPTKVKTLDSGSGRGHEPHFCQECGTYLWSRYLLVPKGLVMVKGGTLDNPNSVEPDVHISVASKQPWLTLDEDATTFDGGHYNFTKVWPEDSIDRYKDATGIDLREMFG